MNRADLVRRARAFAAARHRGQVRKGDGAPFITHPTAVAGMLAKRRMPPEVVAAGYLHDILEDTPTLAAELRGRFGPRVASLVQEVTEPDKKHPWEFRKKAYLSHIKRASRHALAISCADKLHNTLSLIQVFEKEGPVVFDRFSRGVEEKLAYHRRLCAEVRRAWAGCPLLPELEKAVEELGARVGRYHHAMPREVEAKFAVSGPDVLRRLQSLRQLAGLARSSSSRERQRNIYWDTPDFRIGRGRAVLKSRRVGSRGEMTFKREIGYRGGVSERIEVSTPVRANQIPRAVTGELPLEPVRLARKMVGRLAPLQEAVTLYTDRRRVLFGRGKRRIELDLDRVTVHKGDKEMGRHMEVELENRGAPAERYAQALAELRRRFKGRLSPLRTPKYETGLKMVRGLKRRAGR